MNLPVPHERGVVTAWRRTVGFLRRVIDYLSTILTAGGALLFAAASLVTIEALRWTLFWVGAVATLVGLLWGYRGHVGVLRLDDQWRGRYAALEEYTEALTAELDTSADRSSDLPTFVLERMLEQLKLTGPAARASLFMRKPDGTFTLIARHCDDAELRAPSLAQYRADQGAVALGWRKPYLDSGLPKRRDYWNSAMAKRYGIPVEIATELRMQARSLAAVPVETAHGVSRHAIGVVMVEHLDANAINGSHLDSLTALPQLRMLAVLCESHRARSELARDRPPPSSPPKSLIVTSMRHPSPPPISATAPEGRS